MLHKILTRNNFLRTEKGPKNKHFWPTIIIKPFLTNKGAIGTHELMIEHDGNIITESKQVADIMNSFYVNIASHIGGDFDTPKFENKHDLVMDSINYYDNHQSIKII